MAKRDDNPQRLNLVVPLELLEELRTIARERFGAKDNHKTRHPEISQTMLKLIRLGIEAVVNEDIYKKDEDERPISLNEKFDGLARQFGGLADELERVKDRVKELEGAIHTPSQAIQIENEEPIPTPIFTDIQITKGNVEDAEDSEEVKQTLPLIPIPIEENELDKEDKQDEDEQLLLTTSDPVENEDEQDEIPIHTAIQIEEEVLNNQVSESKTQARMARYLDIKQPTLSNWINAKKWDKLESIIKYKEEGWFFNPKSGTFGMFERKL